MGAVDLAIIGGGPGGIAAAGRAAQLGASVALIENGRLGGLCLHWGCIPTKSFIHVAHWVAAAQRLGPVASSGWDPAQYRLLVEQKDRIVDQLAQGVEQSLTRRGIRWIRGRGRMLDRATVAVGEERIAARHLMIATGSSPRRHASFPLEAPWLSSSDDVLTRAVLPARLLIIGGGVSGCEFACLFRTLGARVHLIEQQERLLMAEDEEIVQRLTSSMQRRGIEVIVGVEVVGVEATSSPVVQLSHGASSVEVDVVLVCIGRQPNISQLGLEGVGVQLRPDGWVAVNEHFQTSARSVYAVGDVNGLCPLAHGATYQGIVAAEHAFGLVPTILPVEMIPRGVFTEPELASVGITEAQARARGEPVRVSRVPYRAVSRSQTARGDEGLIKLIADGAGDRLLGAHLLGEAATELIGELTVAIQLAIPVSRLADVVHPHPTYAEGVWQAVRQLCGKPLYN